MQGESPAIQGGEDANSGIEKNIMVEYTTD